MPPRRRPAGRVALYPPLKISPKRVDTLRPFGYTVSMCRIQTFAWQCDVCRYIWLDTGKAPKRCASRKCRSRGWNGERNDGGPGGVQAEHSDRGGDGIALSSVREAASNPERVHPVQPLRGELGERGEPERGPAQGTGECPHGNFSEAACRNLKGGCGGVACPSCNRRDGTHHKRCKYF
jgi:hypothetical protein